MADDDDKPAEPEPKPDDGLGQRVTSLEAGQTTLTEKVDQILGIVSGDGGQPKQDETVAADQGTNVAHEIREGVDRLKALADRQEASSKKAEPKQEPEKPPEPMPRRVERLMGWR